MVAYITIENAKTQLTDDLEVDILKYEYDGQIVSFDISKLTARELKLLEDAIDSDLPHTAIDIFFVDSQPGVPHFGPDYRFSIYNKELIGVDMGLFMKRKNKS